MSGKPIIPRLHRNVAFGQWRGCAFVHVGSFCFILCRLSGERSWGLELCTPVRWVALRPFCRLVWSRT